MALIIDAPMPPSCRWHNTNGRNTSVEICPYLQSCSAEFNVDDWRPSDCPIIGEIPDKHGDLIDRMSAIHRLEAEFDSDIAQDIIGLLLAEPTVVEATE